MLFALNLLALLAATAQAKRSNDCTSCVGVAIAASECSSDDSSCICSSSSFLPTYQGCIDDACETSELPSAVALVDEFCSSVTGIIGHKGLVKRGAQLVDDDSEAQDEDDGEVALNGSGDELSTRGEEGLSERDAEATADRRPWYYGWKSKQSKDGKHPKDVKHRKHHKDKKHHKKPHKKPHHQKPHKKPDHKKPHKKPDHKKPHRKPHHHKKPKPHTTTTKCTATTLQTSTTPVRYSTTTTSYAPVITVFPYAY